MFLSHCFKNGLLNGAAFRFGFSNSRHDLSFLSLQKSKIKQHLQVSEMTDLTPRYPRISLAAFFFFFGITVRKKVLLASFINYFNFTSIVLSGVDYINHLLFNNIHLLKKVEKIFFLVINNIIIILKYIILFYIYN